ncbi:hypothetical protein diail_840 [Diaporthe ilicicola]|nr:hypothetical protein diail_840 [Diaporthe ilicicola]
MVLLTMTPFIVGAIARLKEIETEIQHESQSSPDADPSLQDPAIGKPISHGQIIQLWRLLKDHDAPSYSLENLLWGAKVYVPPAPPKPEPSNEYKALMARLRREEEERKYQRMVSPPSSLDAPAKFAQQFAEVNRPVGKADLGDDDVTMNDVHRQVMLVINFLVTIFGCAATLWIVARWWSTPARLFLTLGGTLIVAIAEVAVYSGYVWHIGQARKKDAKIKEVKEVVDTWVYDVFVSMVRAIVQQVSSTASSSSNWALTASVGTQPVGSHGTDLRDSAFIPQVLRQQTIDT